jgi:hypothetical protein
LTHNNSLKQFIMKTNNHTNLNLDQEFKELTKKELFIIKGTIVLFGMILNICCLHLIF